MEVDEPQEASANHQNSRHMKRKIRIVVDIANMCRKYDSANNIAVDRKEVPSLVAFKHMLRFFASKKFGNIVESLEFVGVCPKWYEDALNRDVYNVNFPEKKVRASENKQVFNELKVHKLLFICENADHDDMYLISHACHKNGFLITNDLLRDHQAQGFSSEWVKERRIGFMWIGKDFLPYPEALVNLEKAFLADEFEDEEEESDSLNGIYSKIGAAPTGNPPSNTTQSHFNNDVPSVQQQTHIHSVISNVDYRQGVGSLTTSSAQSPNRANNFQQQDSNSDSQSGSITFAKPDVLLLDQKMAEARNKMEE